MIVKALEDVGLCEDYVYKRCNELSGGECQRAAIAQALLGNPKMLICDEITSAMDVSVQAQIIALLMRLRAENNLTMLFISHDIALVNCICNRIAIMKRGGLVEVGYTKSIISAPQYAPDISDVDLTISVPHGNGSVQEFHLNGNIAYVDQNLANAGSVGRLNFTLVHEAAHQILGMLYPEEYNPSAQPFICRLADERCTYPITDWVEWQTNVLTAYLLLPRELIDRYMDELGLGRQIKLLNKIFAPKEYALFSEMAKRLGVSKTALSIRLDNLGMIGRNDFSDPYAPIHIDADDFDTA